MSQVANTLERIAGIINASEQVVLLQSDQPDLDSLASAAVLRAALHSRGIDASIVSPKPLKGADEALFGEVVQQHFPPGYDSVILFDTPQDFMIGNSLKSEEELFRDTPFVVIDHHKDMDSFDFADAKWIDPDRPAAVEMAIELVDYLDVPLDESMARHALLGYLYDTRKFMIDRVTSGTFHQVARLVALGVSIESVNREYDQAFALDRDAFRYKGRLIQQVRFYHDGQIAAYAIPRRVHKRFKAKGSLSEHLKYELQQGVAGVLVSVGFIEHQPKTTNVTIRANIPVARRAAEQFGGGGHDMAAGCRFKGQRPRTARSQLVPVIADLIDEYYEQDAAA